jgi:CheY-like chemotaxis protein
MLHVRPESGAIKWLSSAVGSSFPRPLILAGKRRHLQDLDISLQFWASDLLIDLWRPDEMLVRLGLVLARNSPPHRSLITAGSRMLTRTSDATSPHDATGPFGPTDTKFSSEVVVADDDASIRTLVETALENYGVHCLIVSNGTEAIQMIRERRPRAAILDVNMPGKSGFEVLAEIRREELPVRVILLTARQKEDDIVTGFDLGADDYVVKPFNPMELVMRLKRLSQW